MIGKTWLPEIGGVMEAIVWQYLDGKHGSITCIVLDSE